MILVCPHCSQNVTLADSAAAGLVVNCPGCGKPFSVGTPTPVNPSAGPVINTGCSGGNNLVSGPSTTGVRAMAAKLNLLAGLGFACLLVLLGCFGLLIAWEVRFQRTQSDMEEAVENYQRIVDQLGQ